MSRKNEQSVLELLDIYMDLVEKQDDIIQQLSLVIKKQATEIQHMKNFEEYSDFESESLDRAADVAEEYNRISRVEP